MLLGIDRRQISHQTLGATLRTATVEIRKQCYDVVMRKNFLPKQILPPYESNLIGFDGLAHQTDSKAIRLIEGSNLRTSPPSCQMEAPCNACVD